MDHIPEPIHLEFLQGNQFHDLMGAKHPIKEAILIIIIIIIIIIIVIH